MHQNGIWLIVNWIWLSMTFTRKHYRVSGSDQYTFRYHDKPIACTEIKNQKSIHSTAAYCCISLCFPIPFPGTLCQRYVLLTWQCCALNMLSGCPCIIHVSQMGFYWSKLDLTWYAFQHFVLLLELTLVCVTILVPLNYFQKCWDCLYFVLHFLQWQNPQRPLLNPPCYDDISDMLWDTLH